MLTDSRDWTCHLSIYSPRFSHLMTRSVLIITHSFLQEKSHKSGHILTFFMTHNCHLKFVFNEWYFHLDFGCFSAQLLKQTWPSINGVCVCFKEWRQSLRLDCHLYCPYATGNLVMYDSSDKPVSWLKNTKIKKKKIQAQFTQSTEFKSIWLNLIICQP